MKIRDKDINQYLTSALRDVDVKFDQSFLIRTYAAKYLRKNFGAYFLSF